MKKIIMMLLLAPMMLMPAACSKVDDQGNVPHKGDVPEPIDPEHFTILSWTGVKNEYADFGFTKLLEAGFDTYLGWYDNLGDMEYALDAADRTGIKLIVSSPELHTQTASTVAVMTKHASLFGYHIDDEPEVSEFSSLAGQIRNIEQYDSDHPCYVNLYPNWCWGENAYKAKIQSYMKTVPVKYMSFDNYPCKTDGSETYVRSDWYHNLEDIRAVSRDNGVPFWAFALSLSHSTSEARYPVPSLGELRLQMFSNLVYGATGFQYFTTWGHLQDDHVVAPVYDKIKQVNQELRALEKIFLHADIKYVWHTGADIPSGTKKMTKPPTGISKLETPDGSLVVSYLVNNDKQYVAIVNRNPNGGVDVDVDFEKGITAEKYDENGNRMDFQPGIIRLPAGNIVIYSWK